jgi:hypothetical protein
LDDKEEEEEETEEDEESEQEEEPDTNSSIPDDANDADFDPLLLPNPKPLQTQESLPFFFGVSGTLLRNTGGLFAQISQRFVGTRLTLGVMRKVCAYVTLVYWLNSFFFLRFQKHESHNRNSFRSHNESELQKPTFMTWILQDVIM